MKNSVKHTLVICALFLTVLISLNGCSSYNPLLSELDAFACELENNSSSYTVDDWAKSFQTYEEIIDSIESIELTKEETREYWRIKRVCKPYLEKGAEVVKEATSSEPTFLEKVGNFLGGFVEGFLSVQGEF